jgi:hypothetical protein
MSNRIQHRLNQNTSVSSVNTDFKVNLQLTNTTNILPTDEINHIVNSGDQFNKERQNSGFYRIIGTVIPKISNVLFNITGDNSISYFNNSKFRDRSVPYNSSLGDAEDLTYEQSINTFLEENNGWFGYRNPDQTSSDHCTLIDMTPSRSGFDLVNTQNAKNWEIKLTYPAFSARTSGDITDGGLIIIDQSTGTIGNITMLELSTPVKHGLSQGDSVKIVGLTPSSADGTYTVERIGNDTGKLQDYSFSVKIDPLVLITPNTRIRRVVNGQESDYYFRIFETLTDDDDYEMYPLAFARNLFFDKLPQFAFNKDIDVSELRDNLNRPLSELYITFIKNNNKGFSVIKSGIEMPNILAIDNFDNIPDIRRIHNGVTPISHTEIESNILVTDTQFYGDVVEYNKFEVREKVLGEIHHRFNTQNRDGGNGMSPNGVSITLGPRVEGYFYKAHYKIEIRQFSAYVEQGDSFSEGIPDYAESLGDGRYLWRDLLDIGFNDGNETILNYPFLNGCHYMYQNYSLNVRRQDPFGEYNLFYSDFPRDPYGERFYEDDIIVNDNGNDC